MRDIFLAQVLRLFIFAEIVVAFRQAHAALIHFGDHMAGIFEIGAGTGFEERIYAFAVQAGNFRSQIFFRLHFCNCFQVGLQRLQTLLLNSGLVHARPVVVADFLLNGGAVFALDRGLFQNVFQDVLTALGQLIESAPTGAVGGNGVLILPAAASVGVKIVAGIDGLIEHVRVKTDALGGGRRWRGCLRITKNRTQK